MTIIHWPTYEWDTELTWCACDNRTFTSEQAWQDHVVDAVLAERGEKQEMECVDLDYFMRTPKGDLRWGPLAPTDVTAEHAKEAKVTTTALTDCCLDVEIIGVRTIEDLPYDDGSGTYRRVRWEHAAVVVSGLAVNAEFGYPEDTEDTPTDVTAEHADRGE